MANVIHSGLDSSEVFSLQSCCQYTC